MVVYILPSSDPTLALLLVGFTEYDDDDQALDSDDLLYLKEQMEAEEDAERLLRRTEKRAFAAFKISFHFFLNKSSNIYIHTHSFCVAFT
ncbi:hypothetical protein Hanom_Chr04g00385101 [Helianthus anomalus]